MAIREVMETAREPLETAGVLAMERKLKKEIVLI
jgi:hypothetical protein